MHLVVKATYLNCSPHKMARNKGVRAVARYDSGTATHISTNMACRRWASLFSKPNCCKWNLLFSIASSILRIFACSAHSHIQVVNAKLFYHCWCRCLSYCGLWSWNQMTINKTQRISVGFGDVEFTYTGGTEDLIYICFAERFMWPSVNGTVLTQRLTLMLVDYVKGQVAE